MVCFVGLLHGLVTVAESLGLTRSVMLSWFRLSNPSNQRQAIKKPVLAAPVAGSARAVIAFS